jgi:hypothetical protein
VPPGTPGWAFRQVQLLRAIKQFVNWYIDERQIENGEFGGGLSDDGDLTNAWPATALMGGNPEKVRASLRRHMDAFYEQGLFTNGLSTIQADELHSYEEGIQVLGQEVLLEFGDPKQLERAMQTAAALERITGINTAGHRHIRSSYFSGTTIAEEGVWGWQKASSFLALHPAIALVDYNGAPLVKKWLLELADGLLAHYRPRGAGGARVLNSAVEFATDKELDGPGMASSDRSWPLLWAAYRWTGDRKYVQPVIDAGPRALGAVNANALDYLGLRDTWRGQVADGARPRGDRHLGWQVTGDVRLLEDLYTEQVKAAALRWYINTEGSLWIDRVNVPMTEIQRARLGGVALVRNMWVPGHAVSWQFAGQEDEQVAVLIPDATPTKMTVIGYNLGTTPVTAAMSLWGIDPGQWEMTIGTRSDPMSGALAGGRTSTLPLERSSSVEVTFAPGTCTVLELRLKTTATPYWNRPDLGIGQDDVRVGDRVVTVSVHSLGNAATPGARVVLRDHSGREIAQGRVAALPAPSDLKPRSTLVRLNVPRTWQKSGSTITIEVPSTVFEITTVNNRVGL